MELNNQNIKWKSIEVFNEYYYQKLEFEKRTIEFNTLDINSFQGVKDIRISLNHKNNQPLHLFIGQEFTYKTLIVNSFKEIKQAISNKPLHKNASLFFDNCPDTYEHLILTFKISSKQFKLHTYTKLINDRKVFWFYIEELFNVKKEPKTIYEYNSGFNMEWFWLKDDIIIYDDDKMIREWLSNRCQDIIWERLLGEDGDIFYTKNKLIIIDNVSKYISTKTLLNLFSKNTLLKASQKNIKYLLFSKNETLLDIPISNTQKWILYRTKPQQFNTNNYNDSKDFNLLSLSGLNIRCNPKRLYLESQYNEIKKGFNLQQGKGIQNEKR